ncbi:elongation factor G [bacterium]|nr:elongation factor G [bacterium]
MYAAEKIRNVALISHKGAGKTSLAESMLFKSGATNRLGSVDAGSSILDFDEEEKKRKTTISTALSWMMWQDHKINLLDTPGYADFVGEVISSLRAVEGVVVLIDAATGVEVGAEIVWKIAQDYNLPCFIFINKLDKENADWQKAVEQVQKKLSKQAVPIYLPKVKEGNFLGIFSPLETQPQDEPQDEIARKAKQMLIEAVAETSEELLEKYLSQGNLSKDEIIIGLKEGVANRKVFPILCGCGLAEIGTIELLDSIVSLLPSPSDSSGGDEDGNPVKRKLNDPFSGIIFKVLSDPHLGELTFIRVFSGKMEHASEIYNMRTKTKEKLGHLCYILGKNRQDTATVDAGDIGVAIKLKAVAVSDTICDPHLPIYFDPITFPIPAISFAINPKTKQDLEKMGHGLHKLVEEDQTLTMKYDPELSQTIISGLGELHLEIMLSKLKHRFSADVDVEDPKIPYRESIRASAKGEGKYKRQTGGRGQYGHSLVEVTPISPNSEEEFIFENKIFGGAIPGKYIPSIEKGVKEAVDKGVLAGYPVKWVKVKLYDGSFHEVDSSDIAFQLAGSFAFKDAFEKASPYLLEPVFEVEVLATEEHTGDVISDINGRRGRVQGVEGGIVRALIPQSEMYKYSTSLRSHTQGRGSYTMKFSHYEQVPAHLMAKILEERKKEG